MSKGQKRQEIMDAMSDFANDDTITEDDFADTLKSFIDDIEGSLSDALDDMTINSITDIGKLDDAHSTIDELHDSIY